MFQETVSLILKHSDISTTTELSSISNNVGSWSNGKGKTTFRINLRNVLSPDMYDNNEMFILRLNQIAYATANFPVASKDQQLIITLSGLNFINSTYDVSSGNNTLRHQMCLVNMGIDSGVIDYSPNIAMCTFKKSSTNIDLTIELIRTIDNEPAVYGINRFPHCCYSFDIYPVKKL